MGRDFFDREEKIEEIFRSLKQNNILLISPRRYGKTSVMKELERKRIDTRPFFYPMHVLPPYQNNERFPIAEEISRKGINLPSGVGLKEEEIRKIVESLILKSK